MLLGTREKLSEEIVQCFRSIPHLSAAQIFDRIRILNSVTQRAVFKELAKLVDEGVLVRVKGRYAIKVTWILELLQLSEDLTKQSLHPDGLDLQIPPSGNKLRWRFRDLRRMDAFWVQLIFVLFSISSSKRMYVWCPHFWFHLLDLKKELQAMCAMQKGGNKHYLIIGADTFVDRLPTRYWNKKVYEWSYATGPFEGENRRYLDVIDDFVLRVSFSNEFVIRLNSLCNAIQGERDLASADLKRFFDQPSLVTLTLENCSKKANRLRNKFQDFFGH
jgi:hypothetical protein